MTNPADIISEAEKKSGGKAHVWQRCFARENAPTNITVYEICCVCFFIFLFLLPTRTLAEFLLSADMLCYFTIYLYLRHKWKAFVVLICLLHKIYIIAQIADSCIRI